MIEPEKVIAPTAAPIDISIKLANLILPKVPKLKASDLKKLLLQQIQLPNQLNCETLPLIQALLSSEF